MESSKTFKKETDAFKKLSLEGKKQEIEKWISELAEHYDYFGDLKIYISNHESELDEEFLDAVFQIIINLAEEIEKL
jgi:hypothetical protein